MKLRHLEAVRTPDHALVYAVPPDVRNSWCVLLVRPSGQSRTVMPARLRVQAAGDARMINEIFLAGSRYLPQMAGHMAVMHMPSNAAFVHFDLFGTAPLPNGAEISLLSVSRTLAAALLAIPHPIRFLSALLGGRDGWKRRMRSALAIMATNGAKSRSYALWVKLFDTWDLPAQNALLNSPRRPIWPSLAVVVFHNGIGDSVPLNATLAGLRSQLLRVPPVLVQGAGAAARLSLKTALDDPLPEYLVLLQAGEVLAPQALALISDEIALLDSPDAIFADEDNLTAKGQRRWPLFKSEANRTLMLSGTLTRGVWAFRREHLRCEISSEGVWAETVRLDSWLRLSETVAAKRTNRLPFVLTHRHPRTETAPPEALAQIVRQHIDRTSLPAQIENTSFPLRIHFRMPRESQPKVSIVIPTAARSPHVTRCLSAILAKTEYTRFEVVIVVSQTHPLDPRQERILEPVLRDSRATLVVLDNTPFNYSKANNHGMSQSVGEVICLVNDDVEPMHPDWLAGMVGHLGDPAVGAVGAKLYYRNRRVQHGGVIMGLAGLSEHVNRMLPQKSDGYAGRACLNQELSAVTGACLLVRRSVFKEVGGLDETYPIAYNDVDFCLKIRERGWGVVFSAQTEMWHYESVSLGHHFSGERAALEDVEAGRLLARWREVCARDPFHNPNLSLERGNEWELSFPPRVSRIWRPSPDL